MKVAPTRRRGGRIAGFDGLRAVSVLLVFAGHKMVNGLALARDFKDPLPLGSMGVRILFVLSGFLIVGRFVGTSAHFGMQLGTRPRRRLNT